MTTFTTVTLYCPRCSAQNTLPATGLYQAICRHCDSPLSPASPESLAKDALVQTLNTREEGEMGKKDHKRGTKPQSARGPGNEMLRRIGKK